MSAEFRTGLKSGIPIALGYLSVSFAFGIMCINEGGLTLWEATLISLTNVTSAGQVAAIPLIRAQASLMELAATEFIINLRYALMSLSLSQKVDDSMTTLHRMLCAFAITDEIFAVSSAREEKVSRQFFHGLMLMPIIGWAGGTFLGAAAGSILPEFVRTALGLAIYGMFLAIIIPPARARRPVRVVVLAAVGMSVCFRYIPGLNQVSSGFVIIICAVAASALGAALFPIEEGQA